MARTKTSKRKTLASTKISTPAQKKQIPSDFSRPTESASDVDDGEAVETGSHHLSTPTVSLEDISMAKSTPKPRTSSTPTRGHITSCPTIPSFSTHRKVTGNLLMLHPHHKKLLPTGVGDGASPIRLQMIRNLSCLNGIRCTHYFMTNVKSITRILVRRMAC